MAESSSGFSTDVVEWSSEDSVSSNECLETSTTSETNNSTSISILDKLKAPKMSDLTRKRKILRHPPRKGKRYKHPSCSSNPKSVTLIQRTKEFSEDCLTVSAGMLFCEACRVE